MVRSPPWIWIDLCWLLCQEKTHKSYNGSEGESNSQTGEQPPSLLHLVPYFSWQIFCEFPPLWLDIRVGRILNTGIRGRNMLTSNISSRVNLALPSLNHAIVVGSFSAKNMKVIQWKRGWGQSANGQTTPLLCHLIPLPQFFSHWCLELHFLW